jgi:hypothetical protein
MSFIGNAIGDVVGGITGAKQAGKAAEAAGKTQAAAAQAGIEEQRRQFDKLVELMSPYVTAGTGAMAGQQALIGLQGPEAQQQAIAQLEQSPEMQALIKQGENALLQQASATGGLRGGNVQAALAQFRPQVLSSLIGQQYQRLGGLSQMGQASAAGQAAAGMGLGQNVAGLLGEAGAARAGGQIAQGAVPGIAFNQALNIGATIAGAMGGMPGGGGGMSGGGGGMPSMPNLPSMGGGQGLRMPRSF